MQTTTLAKELLCEHVAAQRQTTTYKCSKEEIRLYAKCARTRGCSHADDHARQRSFYVNTWLLKGRLQHTNVPKKKYDCTQNVRDHVAATRADDHAHRSDFHEMRSRPEARHLRLQEVQDEQNNSVRKDARTTVADPKAGVHGRRARRHNVV